MLHVICSSRWVLLNLAQKCPASITWEGEGRVGRRGEKGERVGGERERGGGEGEEGGEGERGRGTKGNERRRSGGGR